MKKFKLFLAFLCLIMMALIGCKQNPDDPLKDIENTEQTDNSDSGNDETPPEEDSTPEYTVTFNSDGGTAIAPVKVKEGDKVTKPTNPTKMRFVFDKWYNGNSEYDFETPVTADLTLKATWAPEVIKPTGMTQVRIYSTENNYSTDFVTKPVSYVVTEEYRPGAPEPWYEKCEISVYDENANLKLDSAKGDVKVRGNWTTLYSKKPLRIKFEEKQTMDKMHDGKAYKNWVLLADYKDFSSVRNAAAFELSKAIDENYYSSDYEMVEVYINGSYWGVYTLAEQQEVKGGRVDITEGKPETDPQQMGYLIEYDDYYYSEDPDTTFELNYNYDGQNRPLQDYYGRSVVRQKRFGYTIKSDVTANQKNFIANYMKNVWKICYEAVYNDNLLQFDTNNSNLVPYSGGKTGNEGIKDCISQVIDLQSLVNTYIHQEIVADADYYLNSFFMDIDFKTGKKLTFEAPWDFDSALGNKRHCENAQGVYAGAIGQDVNYQGDPEHIGICNPWLMVFINEPWFKEMVSDTWDEKNSALSTVTDAIDDITKYESNFAENAKRWPFDSGLTELNDTTIACKTQKEAANYVKNWLNKRFDAIDGIWTNYTPGSYTVRFLKDNGEEIDTKTVNDGNTVEKPATDPTPPEGGEFLGWYGPNGTEFDFTKPIRKDTGITARFAITSATSPQGRLSVAYKNVNGVNGFEVTIRRLNSDPDAYYSNCQVEIPELNISILYDTIKTTDDNFESHKDSTQLRPCNYEGLKEQTVFVPFAEKNKDYTFKYCHQMEDGAESWTEELCTVTALDDGYKMDEFFDMTKEFKNTKMILNNSKYEIKLSQNILPYIHEDNTNFDDICIEGSFVVGKAWWNPGYWTCPVTYRRDKFETGGRNNTPPEITNSDFFTGDAFEFVWHEGDSFYNNLINNNKENGSDTWFVGTDLNFRIKNFTQYKYTVMLSLGFSPGEEATNCKNPKMADPE